MEVFQCPSETRFLQGICFNGAPRGDDRGTFFSISIHVTAEPFLFQTCVSADYHNIHIAYVPDKSALETPST